MADDIEDIESETDESSAEKTDAPGESENAGAEKKKSVWRFVKIPLLFLLKPILWALKSESGVEADGLDDDDKVGEEYEEKRPLGEVIAEELSFFAKLFGFLFLFLTFGFGHYKIPSESMQPTLEVGDHLYVSKFTYGYSRHSFPWFVHKAPFLPDGQIFSRLPKRGDVVVFRNPNTGIVMIKRAVGLPGDVIEMRDGRLILNGELVERVKIDERVFRIDRGGRSVLDRIRGRKKNHQQFGRRVKVSTYIEELPGVEDRHQIYEIADDFDFDNTVPTVVPEGYVFMMGDNRDNSFDSRADPNRGSPGLVPQDHLIGKANMVMFSLKKCPKDEDLYCPPRAFFKGL